MAFVRVGSWVKLVSYRLIYTFYTMADEMQQDEGYDQCEEQNGNAENTDENADNQQMMVDEEDDGEDDR